MTPEEFAELVRLGNEAPGLEFKPPAHRDDQRIRAEVIRAAMALANRRDGGRIVIGVLEDQRTKSLEPLGLTDEQVKSWNRDDLSSLLSRYADPMVDFDQATLETNSRTFLIITVHQFRSTPVVCKQSLQLEGRTVLRAGGFYVRGRRKPESVEVSSYEELREVIDLAVELGVERFSNLARRAGMLGPVPVKEGAKENYDEELEGLL